MAESKGIVAEFKEFISRGNVMDLAVGVVIGGAFGKVVTSLVNDVINPPLGLLLGKVQFSDLVFVLGTEPFTTLEAAEANGLTYIAYGQFINTIIQFLIVAACIFGVVKVVNRIKRQVIPPEPEPEPAPVEPPKSELLLEEIRDLLKSRKDGLR